MQSLESIADTIARCTLCNLCKERTQTVPGSGNPNADIVFIGEGPGAKEDAEGIPFIGSAGKFLDELLASIKLNRSDVFITNVVKCRPPKNRDPLPEEKATCMPYLDAQLDAIKPRILILLGRHAMDTFLPNLKISEAHGQAKRHNGRVYLPMYHPAAALYNGSLRGTLLDDFQNIPKLLKLLASEARPDAKTDNSD